MDKTPRAVFDELDSLTHAISGLSTAMRERTQTETASVRTASPPVVPTSFRRLSPGEAKIERTKETSRRQQDSRTAARINELMSSEERRRASPAFESSGRGVNVTSNPTTTSRQEVSHISSTTTSRQELSHMSQKDRAGSRGARNSQGEHMEPRGLSISTAVKRNITHRRSRDRREEPSGKQSKELTFKRASERPKDQQYRRESGNAIELTHSMKDQNSPMGAATPSPKAFERSFLKRDIPSYDSLPDVHNLLMGLLHERQTWGEELMEAAQDNDTDRMNNLQQSRNECNAQMHEIYLRHMQENEDFHSATASSTNKGDGDESVDFDVGDGQSSTASSSGNHSKSRVGLTCPPTQNQFSIWFQYLDEEESMLVWDTMPLQRLFEFAFRWIVRR